MAKRTQRTIVAERIFTDEDSVEALPQWVAAQRAKKRRVFALVFKNNKGQLMLSGEDWLYATLDIPCVVEKLRIAAHTRHLEDMEPDEAREVTEALYVVELFTCPPWRERVRVEIVNHG